MVLCCSSPYSSVTDLTLPMLGSFSLILMVFAFILFMLFICKERLVSFLKEVGEIIINNF